MIRILHASDNKTVLFIGVTPGHPLDEKTEVLFRRDCSSEIERTLLCEALRTSLGKAMQEIRKVSYLRGWKQAKAHKGGKLDWFVTSAAVLPWEKEEVK